MATGYKSNGIGLAGRSKDMNAPADNKLVRFRSAFLITAAALLSDGCSMEDPKQGVSEDLSALCEIVNLQIPAESARWEVFGTPEFKGGVPGPTDYVTMVAELKLSDPHWPETKKEPTGVTFVAPEAARPWMDAPFRLLMEKNKGANADLSSQEQCRKFETTLKKTGKPVEGFLCAKADQLLLYLTLSES